MTTSFSYSQAVQPKAGTPGIAAEAPSASGGPAGQPPAGGAFAMFLPLIMIVPILFMSFRRQKKEAEARKGLKKGDRVLTNGGMVGELVEMDERLAKLKIAPGTTITVLSSVVSPFETAPAEVKDMKFATEKK